jgi:hypothetical protein
MTLVEFDNGYWYVTELKDFAETIGIPSATKLRKDELEKAIKAYLTTDKIENPTKRNLTTSGPKDVELGLRLDLQVVVYTNDKETKDFLEREAQILAPGMKRKSSVRYRLNRLARRTTHERRQAHLRRPDQRICSVESDQRTLRADPSREIHQFGERFHSCGERRNAGPGNEGMGRIEDARYP